MAGFEPATPSSRTRWPYPKILKNNEQRRRTRREHDGNRGDILCHICANARLIAAAPDMLEVLREIEEFTCDVDDDHPLSHVCGLARAAIVKATGATS